MNVFTCERRTLYIHSWHNIQNGGSHVAGNSNGGISCVVTFTSEGETGQGNGGRVPAPLMIAEKTASEVGVIA